MMEYLNSIMVNGNLLDFDDPEIESKYVPYVINNGLSQHIDTIMYASEMNKKPWMSKRAQYMFLLKSVSKKKRYGKWAKKEEVVEQADIDNIAELYEVSLEKATEYYSLLSNEEIESIRELFFKGGRVKASRKK